MAAQVKTSSNPNALSGNFSGKDTVGGSVMFACAGK